VKDINQAPPVIAMKGLLAVLVCVVMASCTTIPELQVRYTLPSPAAPLKGRSVVLAIDDQRASPSVLGRGAKEEFKGFSGSISLSIADSNKKESRIGIFRVPGLMKEVFKRRLENLGVRVLTKKAPGIPLLTIVLKEFSLDLVGREWLAKMSYEARLTGEKGGVATQFINGQAERYKLIGRESADALMGEIFTDMVNSLNLARLFEQAGLS